MRVDKGKTVTQGNEVIQASYKATLNEKRVLFLGISKINPTKALEKEKPLILKISVAEWRDTYPDDPKPWRSMKRGIKSLRHRPVKLRNFEGSNHDLELSWLDSVDYCEEEGTITIEFGRNISIYLTGNLDQFTSIPLLELKQFHSSHAIRLYELLKQFKHTGQLKISVADFRFSMNCAYPQQCDLKRRVLDPALEEINAKTPMEVKFSQVKRGRTVTHFVFEFIPEERKRPCDNQTNGHQEYIPKGSPVTRDKSKGFANTSTRGRTLQDDMNDVTWVN